MDRPKRSTRLRKPPPKNLINPDDLDLSGIEDDDSDGDFSSASSDEYNPNETKSKSMSEEEEESSEGDEDASASEEEENSEDEKPAFKRNQRSTQNTKKNGRRSHIATLRKEVINKFKSSAQKATPSQRLQDILKKAQFNKKSIFESSEDESGGEEKVPEFDCSGGVQLSDSEDDGDDEGDPKVLKSSSKHKMVVEQSQSNDENEEPNNDMKAVHDNLQRMKEIAEKLAGSSKQISKSSQKEKVNVADILAMGEEGVSKKKSSQKLQKKRAAESDESDDDWEDVEEDEGMPLKTPKEGVEIVLKEFGDVQKRKDVKPADVEAQLKRKFNRIRKEQQEHLHKSELLSWIGHGNFVNSRLNDIDLMKTVLKLLPNNKGQCYPKDKTDIDYFKQIATYFKQEMKLPNADMYCTRLKNRPPIMMSLALQMKFKKAICRRDYVLIFACLLRAIGIQCRVVQSLVCDPKICPKSELLSLSTKAAANVKKTASSTSNKSKSKNSSHSSKSSAKSSKGKVKIPQLDGNDDIPRKRAKSTIDNIFSPKKLRSAQTFKVTIDSPNRAKSSSSSSSSSAGKLKNGSDKIPEEAKKNRALEMTKKATLNIFSPRKTRSKSRDEPPKPASASKSSSSSSTSVKSNGENKTTLSIFSPRKTRSKSRDEPPKPASASKISSSSSVKSNSDKKATTSSSDKKSSAESVAKSSSSSSVKSTKSSSSSKDTLKISLPRTTRSRSREEDPKKSPNKPNLKTLALKRKATDKSDEPTAPKVAKVVEDKPSTSRKREASTKDDQVDKKKPRVSDSSEEGSLKLFKLNKPSTSGTKKSKSSANTSKVDRRVLSSDDEKEKTVNFSASPRKGKGIDIWVEVYSEKEEKWIAIDVHRGKVDCVTEIVKKATQPMVYVFAWNNDNSIKDVSARYVKDLNTRIRKMRVEREYLNSVLHHFAGTRTSRDFKEDDELNRLQLDAGLPKSIAEFKNHPLYALKRHLLKYQALYPPEPPILGYIREEAIYPRDCVFTLHSRETWLKEARVVKLYEQPYKMTTTLKWDKAKNKLLKDVPLELFGIWQTKDYEPPVAENGVVPRNGYGNVELFKPCMLPIGTVHLKLPSLNRVCKKLGIDCAQAVVGFDSNGGWPFPVYDGFVVCKEFEEKVLDAWNRDRDEQEKKEKEKIEKRVYDNWKKLIKGLIIRERLKEKYNFEQKK